jgi:hypothetical protein
MLMSTDHSSSPASTPESPTQQRDEGLLHFYSSEGEALLAQYRRIDFLLGPQSHDHLHTGTLCEVLLRDYFRRVLLPWMGVDKGFIYGRSQDDRDAESSPEIDILIHDQREYRPIFRMDDFVIVQPESVLGIIQVKKRLNTDGRNPLREGIQNVMRGKEHVLQQLLRRHANSQLMERRCKRLIAAVIGFEGRTTPGTYWRYLESEFAAHTAFTDRLIHNVPGSIYTLPHFVGSLAGRFCLRSRFTANDATFRCFSSSFGGHNVAVQMLADICASLIWGNQPVQSDHPPFQYPVGFTHESEHVVRLDTNSATSTGTTS